MNKLLPKVYQHTGALQSAKAHFDQICTPEMIESEEVSQLGTNRSLPETKKLAL
jgi:hypothetical protein